MTPRDERPVSWDDVLLSRLARPVIGRFSGFELIREIGRGAQGIVFLARTREGDRVALKVLRSDGTPRDRARLVREAAVLRDLDHPAVPKVREFLDDGRGVALVTDHVEGVPLDSWARGKSARELARSALRAAEALRVVHDAGVLHHDIKPGHLLVDPPGNVHLLDFGAARARDAVRPTTFVGTLAYAAPERLRASSTRPGPEADLYSLGVSLYVAATGDLPRSAASKVIGSESASGDLRSRRHRAPGVPHDPAWASIVARLLEEHPEDRYRSASELAEDVRRFLAGETPRAHSAHHRLRIRPRIRRFRLRPMAVTMALAITLGGAIIRSGSGEAEARSDARRHDELARARATDWDWDASLSHAVRAQRLYAQVYGAGSRPAQEMALLQDRVRSFRGDPEAVPLLARRLAEMNAGTRGGIRDSLRIHAALSHAHCVSPRPDLDAALAHADSAVAGLRRLGRNRGLLAGALHSRGVVHLRAGRLGAAEKDLGEAVEHYRSAPAPPTRGEISCRFSLAALLAERGEHESAISGFRYLLALGADVPADLRSDSHWLLGRVLRDADDPGGARRAFQDSILEFIRARTEETGDEDLGRWIGEVWAEGPTVDGLWSVLNVVRMRFPEHEAPVREVVIACQEVAAEGEAARGARGR